MGLDLASGYLQLEDGAPGVLGPLPVTPSVGGLAPFTNFSYALQWLTFGLIALIALGYFIRLEVLQRRGRRDRRGARADLRRALAGDETEDPGVRGDRLSRPRRRAGGGRAAAAGAAAPPGVTLAALSTATGISVSTLSRLESGQRRPTLELLLPLAQAHGVPIDELVGAPPTGDPRVHLRPVRRDDMTLSR